MKEIREGDAGKGQSGDNNRQVADFEKMGKDGKNIGGAGVVGDPGNGGVEKEIKMDGEAQIPAPPSDLLKRFYGRTGDRSERERNIKQGHEAAELYRKTHPEHWEERSQQEE